MSLAEFIFLFSTIQVSIKYDYYFPKFWILNSCAERLQNYFINYFNYNLLTTAIKIRVYEIIKSLVMM